MTVLRPLFCALSQKTIFISRIFPAEHQRVRFQSEQEFSRDFQNQKLFCRHSPQGKSLRMKRKLMEISEMDKKEVRFWKIRTCPPKWRRIPEADQRFHFEKSISENFDHFQKIGRICRNLELSILNFQPIIFPKPFLEVAFWEISTTLQTNSNSLHFWGSASLVQHMCAGNWGKNPQMQSLCRKYGDIRRWKFHRPSDSGSIPATLSRSYKYKIKL